MRALARQRAREAILERVISEPRAQLIYSKILSLTVAMLSAFGTSCMPQTLPEVGAASARPSCDGREMRMTMLR